MMLNTHKTCWDVAVVECITCKAHFNCSSPFGRTVASTLNTSLSIDMMLNTY